MADGERLALGLSVGATNLAAVTADRAVTRKPVLTLYRRRPPEVGVPSENPKLNEPGLVITDFVDRVGDPAGIAATDGTMHRSETLVADALRALAYTAIDGGALPDAVAVTHPVHWDPAAVDALRVALSRVSEWSRGRLVLLPDSMAALFALQVNPGVPSRGIVAVCDFGGSGTTLTLVDAANGYQAIAPAVRYAEFSGDRIDQALLTHVVSDLSSAGSFDTSTTSAIGSLSRLRSACRYAKERLSSSIATELTIDVPGYRGEIRLTRDELDDAIRQPLDGFTGFFHNMLQRNGVRLEDLAAVASVGGGASIPLVTRTLSEQSGALVVTAPRPHLTAAVGAALRAARGPADSETALAPTAAGSIADATIISDFAADAVSAPALAWSEAGDDTGITPLRAGEYSDEAGIGALTSARRQAGVDLASQPSVTAADAWYRRPVVVAVGAALAVLAIGAGVMVTLLHTSGNAPSTPTPGVSTTLAPTNQNPGPSDTANSQVPTSSPPSSTESDTGTAPSTTSETPTTTPTSEAPTTTTTTTQAPEPPDRRRFPRGPVGPRFFPQPEPGYR
jgi:actin-like ATPase involved in cell morphogenesis